MKIRPLHDRVVVRRAKEETTSAGGIVIPDSASKEKPVKGEVIAVGTGKLNDNGDVRPIDVRVGNQVLFGKYAGTEIKVDNEDVLVLREDDIMGIIES